MVSVATDQKKIVKSLASRCNKRSEEKRITMKYLIWGILFLATGIGMIIYSSKYKIADSAIGDKYRWLYAAIMSMIVGIYFIYSYFT
jgi:cell division protein FtsW (lipid II flippase)